MTCRGFSGADARCTPDKTWSQTTDDCRWLAGWSGDGGEGRSIGCGVERRGEEEVGAHPRCRAEEWREEIPAEREKGKGKDGKSKGRTVPWLRLVPSDLDLLIEIARLSAPARPPHGSEGVGQGRVLHTGGPSWTRLGSAVKAKTAPAPHLGLGNFQVGVCRDSRLHPLPPPPPPQTTTRNPQNTNTTQVKRTKRRKPWRNHPSLRMCHCTPTHTRHAPPPDRTPN